MIKLSSKPKYLLDWMLRGNSIELCTTPGRSFHRYNFSNYDHPQYFEAALNTLISYGLIKETEFEVFGLRWSRLQANADEVAIKVDLGAINENA